MKKLIVFALLLLATPVFCQDNLLDEIDQDSPEDNYASATFKGLKIVNFESTKLTAKKEFTFVVAHRFGTIKNGFDSFFGLDDAVTRINFIYGVNDWLNVSVSRSSFQKIYEGALKYQLVKQKKGGSPFTIVGYNSMLINTALDKNNLPRLKFENRLGYATQLLIARKFNKNLSLQLAPTVFHDNYVADNTQDNTQYAIGIGGRHKLTKRWSVNIDYGWHLNRSRTSPFKKPTIYRL